MGSYEVHVLSERKKAGNYRGRSYLYLAEFLKNNLTNFAVICLKRPQKAGFFGPDKLQNHSSDGKGKEKKAERGGRKKEKRKKQCLHSKFL